MTIKQHPIFTNFHEVQHPLLQHKLSLMRDKNTNKKEFKELVNEISMLLAYEVTKDLPLIQKTIETPIETCETPVLAGKKPVVLPILRAVSKSRTYRALSWWGYSRAAFILF